MKPRPSGLGEYTTQKDLTLFTPVGEKQLAKHYVIE